MRIVCTVEEFGKIVRGCNEMARIYGCINCPLHDVCGEEAIEHFIAAGDIVLSKNEKDDAHDPRKCRFFQSCYGGDRCTGTKELDFCEGEKCKRWKPSEEDAHA